MLSHSTIKSSFQGDEAETAKKPKFVSPYQRYKCVIPVIVEMEAQEQEVQQKKEEEKRLSETVQDLNVNQVEIDESKERVYEHFKQVVQASSEVIQDTYNVAIQGTLKKKKKKKKKKSEVILGQMQGKKRKRESDIAKESATREKGTNNYCTPAPSLNNRILHIPKKMKRKMQSTVEQQRVQETLARVQSHNNAQLLLMR